MVLKVDMKHVLIFLPLVSLLVFLSLNRIIFITIIIIIIYLSLFFLSYLSSGKGTKMSIDYIY